MNKTNNTLNNYIDGEWRESSDRATFANENPAQLGSKLNLVAASTEEDIAAAIAAAARAFATWGRTALPERQAAVERFLNTLAIEREALAKIVCLENGKTIREARGEVDSALLEGRHHLRQMAVFAGQSAPSTDGNVISWEQFHPLGVVGVISP